jgi:PilZ domain
MANALFVDALKGYEYYLENRGNITLDQVNRYLLESDRNPIALRTYTHYRHLLNNGFRSYIPINKFDVFQAIGRVQIAADRRRFDRHPTELQAQISRDGIKWRTVRIIDRSIVGFGIVTEEKFPTTTGVSGWVRSDSYIDMPVVIVWRNHEQNSTRLGMRAMEFLAKYRLHEVQREIRTTKSLRIKRSEISDLDWDNIFGVLERVNEVIKSATDLFYILEDLYEIEINLARPQLEFIKFGSPGDTSIKLDFGIAEILRVLLEKIQFWGLQKRQLKAEIIGHELSNEAIRLANANTKIEMIRNAVKLSKEVDDAQLGENIANGIKDLVPNILGVRRIKPETFSQGSPEKAILDERLIPASANLIAGDDTEYSVNIEGEGEFEGQDESE